MFKAHNENLTQRKFPAVNTSDQSRARVMGSISNNSRVVSEKTDQQFKAGQVPCTDLFQDLSHPLKTYPTQYRTKQQKNTVSKMSYSMPLIKFAIIIVILYAVDPAFKSSIYETK